MILLNEQRLIVAYLDGLQAKVNALQELQSMGGEELSVNQTLKVSPADFRPDRQNRPA